MTQLLDPLFRWEPVQAIFSDRACVQAMLDFEAALARASARAGVIPESAGPVISARCRAEEFDLAALGGAAALAGNLAIPLVEQLTALVGRSDPEAQRFVHWGATSQDVLDTAFVLQLRRALGPIEAELARLADGLARLTAEHRATPAVARTLMQHALPTTFGLKAAGWLDAVGRHRGRLKMVRSQLLVLQLGGAAGTLAAFGDRGLEVARGVASDLGLRLPDLPWHAHRDRVAEVATTIGLATGTLAKIARDLALYMQTEIAEAFEPAAEGRGGSSTLPHKRNPVACAVALAAAARMPGLVATMLGAMPQEQERGVGGWHAEWETMPEILGLFAGALHHLADTVAGLEVDAPRMRQNLDATKGLVFAEAVQMAVATRLGRAEAKALVAAACRRSREEGRHLREVLADDPAMHRLLDKGALDRLFDPGSYLGAADAFVERVLVAHRAVPAGGGETGD